MKKLTTLILSLSGKDTSLPYDTEDAGESGGGYKSGTGLTLVVLVLEAIAVAPCATDPLSGTRGADDARRNMDVRGTLKRGGCAEDMERAFVILTAPFSMSTSTTSAESFAPRTSL